MYVVKNTKYKHYVRYYLFVGDEKDECPSPIARICFMKKIKNNKIIWIIDEYFVINGETTTYKNYLSNLFDFASADIYEN